MSHKIIAEDGKRRQHRQCLQELMESTDGPLRVASAYITDKDLLLSARKRRVQLLTSFSDLDIISGATSLACLKSLIEAEVECFYLPKRPRLHAKVYIFGDDVAVVTSANLTNSAMDSNIEVGVQIAGIAVKELSVWFDAQLSRADRLQLGEVSDWLQRFADADARSKYRRFLDELTLEPILPVNESSTSGCIENPEAMRSFQEKMKTERGFSTSVQYFLCNTNRRNRERIDSGGFKYEELMRSSGYALTWESFRSTKHMKRVRKGDVIFMFAKGLGIIAIGEATDTYRIRDPGDRDRIEKDIDGREWQIPALWWFWNKDDPFEWEKTSNSSFIDVSDGNWKDQREAVLGQLFGDN